VLAACPDTCPGLSDVYGDEYENSSFITSIE